MSEESTIVTIHYHIQPGMGEAVRQALQQLIATVVATEPDCLGIQLLHDPADETRVLLVERWRSRAAYEGPHMQTPHLLAFMGDARAWLSGPPTIEFWPHAEHVGA